MMRLISRCSLNKSGTTDIKTLFTAYELECKDDGKDVLCTVKQFSEIVLNLFKSVSRMKVRKAEKTFNIYSGLQLKPLGPLKPLQNEPADFSKFMLPSITEHQFIIVLKNDHKVECEFVTDFLSNGNEVRKKLIFKNDNSFQVFIGDKAVDLKSLGITPCFVFNEEGILDVCTIVKRIRLCYGVTLNKESICTRLHTIESWKTKTDNNTLRQLRSLMCCRVVKFNSRTNACNTCQHMTFQKKIPTSDKENTKPNQKVTKEDFKKMIPNASEEMLELLISQVENNAKFPNTRRWSKEMISTCLQIYTRSPNVYKMMRDSQLLILPSTRLLVSYKSKVKHEIGFSPQIFRWMHAEACRLKLTTEGCTGGIIMDEMAIQQDLQILKNGDVVKLVGAEDVGEEGNVCSTLRKGELDRKLGSHILQFMFVGLSGFRFPFAHFVTTNVQAYELYVLFWEAVQNLRIYDFNVVYVSMDGAQSNRTFMNINLGKAPNTMICKNPSPFDDSVVFIMDPSHMVKKIRNNIIKSGITKGCTRNLTLPDGNVIMWQMWIDAFKWDQCNALKIHHKLSSEHIFPTSQGKMRNRLAEEALNSEMLYLFEQYQSSLSNGNVLNGATELLKKTSCLIDIFSDKRPILSSEDYRLTDVMDVYNWFRQWQYHFSQDKDKTKKLMSAQCMEDIASCLLGFHELCHMLLTKKSINIIPAMINSDIIENHFCQQRATFNGANSNPTALQYRRNLNSIIISQNLVSQKANAGKSSIKSPSLAFTTASKTAKKRALVHTIKDDQLERIKVMRM